LQSLFGSGYAGSGSGCELFQRSFYPENGPLASCTSHRPEAYSTGIEQAVSPLKYTGSQNRETVDLEGVRIGIQRLDGATHLQG